jgi:stringent starvation protein B
MSEEDHTRSLNLLKRHVFYELLNAVGRVFILVAHSERVVLGNRGFTPAEQENGLVLVFNVKMNFTWDDEGISAKLAFGHATQQCYIPADTITAVYSPELGAQFAVLPGQKQASDTAGTESAPPEKEPAKEPSSAPTENVVKVDFSKRKKA